MSTQNSTNTQAGISIPANPNSPTPQIQPYFVDPYSPFWILFGLAILLGQVKPRKK